MQGPSQASEPYQPVDNEHVSYPEPFVRSRNRSIQIRRAVRVVSSKTMLNHNYIIAVLFGCLAGLIAGPVCAEDDWISLGQPLLNEPATQPTAFQLLEEQDEPLFPTYDAEFAAAVRGDDEQNDLLQTSMLQDSLLSMPMPQPGNAVEPAALAGCANRPRGWQVLPQGIMFQSYLAGEKEPRMAAQWMWDRNRGLVFETALGGRWGLVRNGTYGGIDPEGFQFDIEGAAFARVDPEEQSDLEAADFRAGFVGTWHEGPWRFKTGYYHISSHIGDEYLLRNNGFQRINYVRDSLLAAAMYNVNPDLQVYAEVAVALNHNGGAEPFELQFGAQYSPVIRTGIRGAPFAAINGHLRQEFNFGGSVNVQAGWQWRSREGTQMFRMGFQHYNGPSIQWELFDVYESMTGMGIWFDF